MQSTLTQTAVNLLDEGKKSLDALLRESAYEEVKAVIEERGIDIDTLTDAEVETLVAARVEEKRNGIKGFATGAVLALLLSTLLGA